MSNPIPIAQEPQKMAPKDSDPLPEEPKNTPLNIKETKALGIRSIISKWMPMGIRVGVPLPFISNDSDWLFTILHSPYIPTIFDGRNANKILLWNSFRNVVHAYNGSSDITNNQIKITQHTLPPILSALSTIYRFWRGSIKFRIRAVTNFTTQGYLITAPLKNAIRKVGKYNPFKEGPSWQHDDISYLSPMTNGFISTDLSQIRHQEITIPYEKNVDYVDQFQAIAVKADPNKVGQDHYYPHGEDYVAIGVRGTIAAADLSNEAWFELEYAAGDDFEFGGEFLVPTFIFDTNYDHKDDLAWPTVVPSDLESDGIDTIEKPKPAPRRVDWRIGGRALDLN